MSRLASLGVPADLLRPPALDALVTANASLAKLASPPLLDRIATEWARTQRPWLDSMALASKAISGPDAAMLATIAHVSKIANVSSAAEALFRRVQWEKFVTAPVLPAGAGARLKADFLAATEAYADLSAHLDPDIVTLPPPLTALPPVEMYAGADLVRSVSPGKPDDEEAPEVLEALALRRSLEEETAASLEEALTSLDPNLIRLWRGARAALSSKNPDRVRHVTVSLRELWTQVVHRLAPDDEVRAWTSDPSHYDEKGRPTRRARCLFICRKINSGPFIKFVDLDVNFSLAFLEAFQGGTHRVVSELSDQQLEALISRMESVVRFLLAVGL